jgi:histidinol-phosphatase
MDTERNTIEAVLELGVRLADRADAITMQGFYEAFDVYTKEDGSPVTSVDREVEVALRDLIAWEHRSAGVLGEEYGSIPGEGRWVLDPIDGTREFIDGDPRFATLAAYETEDGPIVGVVSAPALGLRWWAGRGLGAFFARDGAVAAARVSITSDLPGSRGLLPSTIAGEAPTLPPEALDFVGRLSTSGASLHPCTSSWQAVRVATGDYDAAFARGAWWDVAPLSVIIGEAGGCSVRFYPQPRDYGVALTNRLLAPKLFRVPAEVGADRSAGRPHRRLVAAHARSGPIDL